MDIVAQLRTGLAELGLSATAEQVEQLERYTWLLLERNRVTNLTAIREPAEVVRLHMLDSAAAGAYGALTSGTLLDVGTGAGFPGMVLAVLEPGLSVTLLDSLGKRIEFLRETASVLGLTNVTVVQGRAEELGRDASYRGKYGCVTARAVAALPMLSELCFPFVRTGGWFFAMKGAEGARELEASLEAIRCLGGGESALDSYVIPGTEVRHQLIRIRKAEETPEGYPRKYAKLKRAPLGTDSATRT